MDCWVKQLTVAVLIAIVCVSAIELPDIAPGIRPIAHITVGMFLGSITLTSLPMLPLGLLAVVCGDRAWMLIRRRIRWSGVLDESARREEERKSDLRRAFVVDPISIELGYALIRLVDVAQGGDLLKEITALRRQIASELDIVLPPVSVRDNLKLGSHNYRISVQGRTVATGRIRPDRLLVAGERRELNRLLALCGECPTMRSAGMWIRRENRNAAEILHLVVTEPIEVMISHLGDTVRTYVFKTQSGHNL